MIIEKPFRILSLDGGGSKGVYTLGVLIEFEKLIGKPLWKWFDLIYGTSTGSIIGSLVALGFSARDVLDKYYRLIPEIMKSSKSKNRTKSLISIANSEFGNRLFDSFKTNMGIVATNYDCERPIIFKSSNIQAHGLSKSFEIGFGCTIADAVVCSCSAYPFFEKRIVCTKNQGNPTVIDGGFVANNPTLFAICDATMAFGKSIQELEILSVGVGNYPVPKRKGLLALLNKFEIAELPEKIFRSSSTTVDILRTILYPTLKIVRIDESFSDKKHEISFVEADIEKVKKLSVLGRESFRKSERQIIDMFGIQSHLPSGCEAESAAEK